LKNLNSKRTFYYSSYDSADNFYKQSLDAYEKLAPESVKKIFRDRVTGSGEIKPEHQEFYAAKTVKELKYGNLETFIDPKLITKMRDRFKGVLDKIDMGGAFEKDRLVATKDSTGIFDFGLASKGLMRKVEFYDPILFGEIKGGKKNPFENYGVFAGVVPSDFVRKEKQFYYHEDPEGKWLVLDRRQSGVTEALSENPNLATHFAADGLYTLVKPNKHLKFYSTYEKCYLKHKFKGGKQKTVDFYVPQGGSWQLNYEQLAYKAFPALLAAEVLEEAGIKTRINVVNTGGTMDRNNVYFFTYPIKNYGDEFDWNKIMLHIADPRLFRWSSFKSQAGALLKNYSKQKNGKAWTKDAGLFNGTTVRGDLLTETFERFKKYAQDLGLEGLSNIKTTDRNKMWYSHLPNDVEADATEDEIDAVILDEFNNLMDKVDLEFNDTEKVAKRIVEREREKGTDVKAYLKNTIDDAYALPTVGEFKATEDEVRLNEDISRTKNAKIDEYFS
jgi:hypothetical protein